MIHVFSLACLVCVVVAFVPNNMFSARTMIINRRNTINTLLPSGISGWGSVVVAAAGQPGPINGEAEGFRGKRVKEAGR